MWIHSNYVSGWTGSLPSTSCPMERPAHFLWNEKDRHQGCTDQTCRKTETCTGVSVFGSFFALRGLIKTLSYAWKNNIYSCTSIAHVLCLLETSEASGMGKNKIRPLLGYSSTCVLLWLQSLGRAGRDKKRRKKQKKKTISRQVGQKRSK